MTTIRELLREARHRLEGRAAALESEMLLALALGVTRAHLFAHPEKAVPDEALTAFNAMIGRRSAGEPMAYITGVREFWSLPLSVSPAVLIPRPETEVLVQAALDRIPPGRNWRIADIGTGSGAIALAIAHERPGCEVHASDISAQALEVAAANASNLSIENISFHRGSWLEPLLGTFDLVASNPPYVAPGDPHLQQGDLRFEPQAALVSGPDGLEAIRTISRAARARLRPRGWLVLEHGHDQARACAEILGADKYDGIETFPDLEGTNRVTIGRLK